jgi:hypothetical protein
MNREVEILREIINIQSVYINLATKMGAFTMSPKDMARLTLLNDELKKLC